MTGKVLTRYVVFDRFINFKFTQTTKSGKDHISVQLLRLDLEFRDAIDGERVLRCWKYMIPTLIH